MKFPVVSKVTFTHWSASVGLTSFAWFAVTGEVLRDLASLGSVLVSAAALFPAQTAVVQAWLKRAVAWVGSKL